MAEPLPLDEISEEDREFLQTTLDCDGNEVFDLNDGLVYVPLAFARQNFEIARKTTIQVESRFTGDLRQEQLSVYSYVVDKLKTDGFSTVSARPGFGKTITSIAIACTLGMKTLIVVNKIVLIDQWCDSIKKFAPSVITSVIKPDMASLDQNATFYIVNAINIVKKPQSFWSTIQLLVVDELHQIITKKLVVGLLRIVPIAILGLSATPYRHDSYNKAVEWFFGKNIIGNTLNQPHTFRVVRTGFTPIDIQYTPQGLNWGKILEEQAGNESRNECIVQECISEAKTRTVLVLVKRVAHAELLVEMIRSRDETIRVSTLVRSERTFDKNCKILIGTTSKIGVGFDHAPINCLVVAADVKNYFVQFLGRCMRNPDSIPTVVDFDDDFSILKKHLLARIKEYKKHGGTPIDDCVVTRAPPSCQPKLDRWFKKKSEAR